MAIETNNYKFQKPGDDDFYDIEIQNRNWDKADTALKDLDNEKVSQNGGDLSETNIKTLDDIPEEFPVPATGEKTKSFLGKVKKSMEDWKNFKNGIVTLGMLSNQYENSTNKIPTSALVYSLKQITDQLNSNLGEQISDLDNPVSGAIVPNKLYVRRYSASATHVPSATHGTLYHMYIDGVPYATQLAVDLNRDIFIRARNAGSWSHWEGCTKNADFKEMPRPTKNTALLKEDTSAIFANDNMVFIRFNFKTVDNLPTYNNSDNLLSGLPAGKAEPYFYINAFPGNGQQRCTIYHGNLQLLYQTNLEANTVYNASIMYPIK